MIRLYDYWRSSASYRVRMALHLCRLQYDSIAVNLVAGEQHDAAYAARNTQGMVPTLEIDGLSLTQSLAIIEYLNDTRGGLMPADPAGRARVRMLSHSIAMDVAPICNLRVRTHVQNASKGVILAEDWQRHFISLGLSAYEAMLAHPATGRFCHGDRITMADLCLLPQVYNAERLGMDLGAQVQIHRIADTLRAIPEIAAAHPDRAIGAPSTATRVRNSF